MNSGKAVSLLEILRSYADAYARGADVLRLAVDAINMHRENAQDFRENALLMLRMRQNIPELFRHCEYLPMTQMAIDKVMNALNSEYINHQTQPEHL